MGGIPTNMHGQVCLPEPGTDNYTKPVKGFYAIGECSCVSVHGANRLGTNSLLDLVVFGKAAGEHIIDYVTKHHGDEYAPLPTNVLEQTLARVRKLMNQLLAKMLKKLLMQFVISFKITQVYSVLKHCLIRVLKRFLLLNHACVTST